MRRMIAEKSSEAPPDSDMDSLPSPLPGSGLITADTSDAGAGKKFSLPEPETKEQELTSNAQVDDKNMESKVTPPASQVSSERPVSGSKRFSQIYEWVAGKTFGKAQVSEIEKLPDDEAAKDEIIENHNPIFISPDPESDAPESSRANRQPELDMDPKENAADINILSQDKMEESPPQYSATSDWNRPSSSRQGEEADINLDYQFKESDTRIVREGRQPQNSDADAISSTVVPEEQGTLQSSSSYHPIKKHVRFTNGDSKAEETTPLIQSQPNATLTSSVAPLSLPASENSTNQRSNGLRSKMWMWFLIAGILFLANALLLTILFSGSSKLDNALDDLLSEMNPKQLRRDLEALQNFTQGSRARSGAYPSAQGELDNFEYIETQLRMLSGFDIEIQNFSRPQWVLESAPSMTLYFDWQVPLEYQRDFIVLPYSGGTSGIHNLITRHLISDSCSLFDQRAKEHALLVPYPNYEKYGITKPCLVWDLAYSAQEAGATAVVFYLEDYASEFPVFDDTKHPLLLPQGWQPRDGVLNIPVLLLNRRSSDLLQKEPLGIVGMNISVSFFTRLSKNLIAKSKQRTQNTTQHPIIIGAHWDSDPLSHDLRHFKVTGAAGLLAAARAIDGSGFRFKNHPIHLVWFGFRSPLQLELMKCLEELDGTQLPYFYLDLGRLEGTQPILFDTKKVPYPYDKIASTAQTSMGNFIKYEINHPRHRDRLPSIPLYGLNGTLGAPETAFIKYKIPAAGISSQQLSNSTSLQAEMVFQVTSCLSLANPIAY
ncbi:hypothetical protein DSO57_1000593 [Entomophthora muscae]|uniref:Uncharacterized protein n=1 Tax=Entomophthora muscae TaxID=34485 RepID=A0ACC2S033_9FUNG|nr:hypothetical protein DSO57_1000593 [Entomophthora muscae]